MTDAKKMRVGFRFPPELVQKVKQEARRQRRTETSIIEEALEIFLHAANAMKKEKHARTDVPGRE